MRVLSLGIVVILISCFNLVNKDLNSFKITSSKHDSIIPRKIIFTFWKKDSVSTNDFAFDLKNGTTNITLPLLSDSFLAIVGIKHIYTLNKCEYYDEDTLCEMTSNWKNWTVIMKKQHGDSDLDCSKFGTFYVDDLNNFNDFTIDYYFDGEKICVNIK